ncbi:sugar MFS transporter [uncultured Ruthenibacterium sp.]|uniref:MFS transporter n=1 Tax=uncultured Ruthenibacterium sp. TaxID=1905347 RepID=UPI00349E4BAB
MATVFLALIYASFVSLGLPDAVLGAAWPVMGKELAVPDGYAGLLSMTVAGGTVVSSLLADRLLSRFGTGRVTAASVALTAAALLGYCFAPGFFWLVVLAVPLGLGAGAVDAGLNNFVALHYGARHMNWLHCFWGLGAMLGPLVLTGVVEKPGGWRIGYGIVSGLQWVLVAVLAATLPLWNRFEHRPAPSEQAPRPVVGTVVHLPGAAQQILAYFFYCSIEATAGLWAASWLGVDVLFGHHRRPLSQRLRHPALFHPDADSSGRRGVYGRHAGAGLWSGVFVPRGSGPGGSGLCPGVSGSHA